MKLNLLSFFFSFFTIATIAQIAPPPEKVNEQRRFYSDNRLFYTWNEETQVYEIKDTEYENSIIEIREMGAKSNGYIILSLNDDATVRLHHGSIVGYEVDENGISKWSIRSKFARGKVVLDPEKKTVTFSYDSDKNKRYLKIFVFNLVPDAPERVK